MEKLTREQMIYELTKFEIEYIMGDNYLPNEMVTFFSNGGFNNYAFDELERAYTIIFQD